jgi:peptide/nickel transport system substrate-binding protein
MGNDRPGATGDPPGWSRRTFLRNGALAAGLLSAGGLVAGCAGTATGAVATLDSKPVRGGILQVGATGGGTTDTLDPQNWATNVDQLRIQQLFDPLVWMNDAGAAELTLATSITPNADATEWTIEIPAGVTTHRGQPFTAADVLYSLRRIVANLFPGASVLGPADLRNSRVLDSTRLLLRYSKPFGALVEALTFPFFYMVPRGFNPNNPDGTGPFKYQSFTPGTQSTFVRNVNYWQPGKPYLDSIVTTDVADESTQVDGLLSGQFDVINALSASSVAALSGTAVRVAENKSGIWVPFTQDCDLRPFSDVRVRQAMRLIVDRPQMLEQVFDGYGSVANDMFSPYDPGYPDDVPQRVQDIPQAKSLLKAAGYPDLQVSLLTAPVSGGEVSMAEVFATQAKAAGVQVGLQLYTVGDFYAKYYQKVPFAMDYGTNQLYLANAGQLMIGKTSFFNACHFNDPEYNSLYYSAIATTDSARRNDLIGQLARIDHERGAYIVPVFSPVIEAYAANIGGIRKSVTGVSPGNADFKNFWIA